MKPEVRTSAAYRIGITCAAVLAWMILLLGGVVYWAADAEFRKQRDQEIAAELERLAREPDARELMRELAWREGERSTVRFRYAFFDRQGRMVAGTIASSPFKQGFGDLVVREPDGTNRVMRAGSVDLAHGGRLVVAEDSATIDRVTALILKLFLGAFMALLLISALGAVILGWYLRRRLIPITATADAIITGDLKFRVPVGKRQDEFDAAGQTINIMLDRVEALMENLRQVSSDIAHDLRKPLMRLLWQTDRLGKVEGAEQRVFELGDELLSLFTAILRISEVEGGGLEGSFVRIDLSALLEELAESFELALADDGKTLHWTIEPDVVVMGNREVLAQLVSNLLDNARIHTPVGTVARLLLEKAEDEARLIVEDSGFGVPEADLEKLLQRFYRAEASRTTPGNGLGLSLVVAAARAHGGAIVVENATPGLRISVTLPRFQ
ncbi:MAG TPA: ATP-binding protein [Novosphingobium sp.]